MVDYILNVTANQWLVLMIFFGALYGFVGLVEDLFMVSLWLLAKLVRLLRVIASMGSR